MKLIIDGMEILARPGQTLLDLVKALGLDSPSLRERPLAAKIAGEVFTLNYIPVRQEGPVPAVRRAMAASGGVVELLRYTDPVGKEVYERTARFVVFLAL